MVQKINNQNVQNFQTFDVLTFYFIYSKYTGVQRTRKMAIFQAKTVKQAVKIMKE